MARAAIWIAACAAGLAQPLFAFAGQPAPAGQSGQTGQPGQDDAFLRQHQKELAQYDSTGFSVAFQDERRAYRSGEAIPLRLTFDLQARDDVSPGNYEHCHGLGVADAVLDRTEGTADPQVDLWKNGAVHIFSCGILGGRMGGTIAPGNVITVPPVTFVAYLNQAVRFDRPGVYRFYIRSRHRMRSVGAGPPFPPLISDVLTIEILPRDPAWEARTLAEALAVLDAPDAPAKPNDWSAGYRAYETRAGAQRIISYLASDEAVDEMVRRFDNTSRTSPPDPGRPLQFWVDHWIRGLYGSPNRTRVVARMTRELDRAGRYISPQFIAHLAVLELTQRDTVRPIARSRYEARVRALTARRQQVLAKAGR